MIKNQYRLSSPHSSDHVSVNEFCILIDKFLDPLNLWLQMSSMSTSVSLVLNLIEFVSLFRISVRHQVVVQKTVDKRVTYPQKYTQGKVTLKRRRYSYNVMFQSAVYFKKEGQRVIVRQDTEGCHERKSDKNNNKDEIRLVTKCEARLIHPSIDCTTFCSLTHVPVMLLLPITLSDQSTSTSGSREGWRKGKRITFSSPNNSAARKRKTGKEIAVWARTLVQTESVLFFRDKKKCLKRESRKTE